MHSTSSSFPAVIRSRSQLAVRRALEKARSASTDPAGTERITINSHTTEARAGRVLSAQSDTTTVGDCKSYQEKLCLRRWTDQSHQRQKRQLGLVEHL